MSRAPKPLLLDKAMLGGKLRSQEPIPSMSPPLATPKGARDYGVPLNFRVSEEFNKRFRHSAIDKNLKLHQLLERCYEVWAREEGGN